MLSKFDTPFKVYKPLCRPCQDIKYSALDVCPTSDRSSLGIVEAIAKVQAAMQAVSASQCTILENSSDLCSTDYDFQFNETQV
jgi:hypothetical protein